RHEVERGLDADEERRVAPDQAIEEGHPEELEQQVNGHAGVTRYALRPCPDVLGAGASCPVARVSTRLFGPRAEADAGEVEELCTEEAAHVAAKAFSSREQCSRPGEGLGTERHDGWRRRGRGSPVPSVCAAAAARKVSRRPCALWAGPFG